MAKFVVYLHGFEVDVNVDDIDIDTVEGYQTLVERTRTALLTKFVDGVLKLGEVEIEEVIPWEDD